MSTSSIPLAHTTSSQATERIAPAPAPAPESATAAAIRRWRERLLDAARQGPLLDPGRAAAAPLEVAGEAPAELLRHLRRGAEYRFAPAAPLGDVRHETPDEPAEHARPDDARDDAADAGALARALADASPYRRQPRIDGDHVLRAALDAGALDAALRALADARRATLDEQGEHALVLAIGSLTWRDAPDGASASSGDTRHAPILLVPVTLGRAHARAEFLLSAADDEPVVNPTLRAELRRVHGVSLPELPESLDELDPAALLAEAQEQVRGRRGWKVTSDVALAVLPRREIALHDDLERNAARLERHRLVRALAGAGEAGEATDAGDPARAPAAARQAGTAEPVRIVDADADQLRAASLVAAGHDLIIEGAPGTGKSQTAVNVIAGALARGERVLLVADKGADIDAVARRLDAAGLGDFCLDLRGGRDGARAVVQELRRTLDAALAPAGAPLLSTARQLDDARSALDAYVRALHEPFGALAASPYDAYGTLASLADAPRARWTGDPRPVTREQLDEAARALERLAETSVPVGDPRAHPWRDTRRTYYPEAVKDELEMLLADVLRALDGFAARAAEVAAQCPLPAITTLRDAEQARRVAAVLSRSPGAPVAVLASAAWDAAPQEALDLIAFGRSIAGRIERAGERFTPGALDDWHEDDVAFMRARLTTSPPAMNALNARFRGIRQRWTLYRQPEYDATLLEQADHLEELDALQRDRRALQDQEARGQELFGALWRGEASDWDALDAYVRWVVELRALRAELALPDETLAMAAPASPDVTPLLDVAAHAAECEQALARVGELVQWPAGYLTDEPVAVVRQRLGQLWEHFSSHGRWAAFVQAQEAVERTVAAEMIAPALDGTLRFAELPRVFLRAFHRAWLDAAVEERPALRDFDGLTHERRRREFRALDRAALEERRAELAARARERTRALLASPEVAPGLRVLRREMARQQRHGPLARTLAAAFPAVAALRPVWLVPPATVGRLLADGDLTFDLVILDQASRLTTESAIGAIARGRQVVALGDTRGMPPARGVPGAAADAAEEPATTDAESVLEALAGAGVETAPLRRHYRSRHESLIAFASATFYDGAVRGFPSPDRDRAARGVRLEHVADGACDGRGVNRAEARRVADAVAEHARRAPHQSLGVVTLGAAQRRAIADELELRRRRDPSLEAILGDDAREPFFVKTVEEASGDDRDVILVSLAHGREADGRIGHQFGALNGPDGWRRLDVIATRARERLDVFASVRWEDIDLTRTQSEGVRLLRDFLRFAETGETGDEAPVSPPLADAPFERDVDRELTRRGLRLVPRVGATGYRVDFAVVDPAVPERYICGLQCDGAQYRAAETASERDRLHDEVLEGLGWTIHRIWSTTWFKHRDQEVARVLALVQQSRARSGALETPADVRPADLAPEPSADAIGIMEPTPAEPSEEQPLS